jgi:hypothetical protein
VNMHHISAVLVHDIVDEHAHICTDCPPSARMSVITQSGLQSLIRQLTTLGGTTIRDVQVKVIVEELDRHVYSGSGKCSCGAEPPQPFWPNWDRHRAEAILTALDAIGSKP